MSPSKSKEVRVTKRVLLVIYLVFVLFLCVATTVSIVRTLAGAQQPVPATGTGVGTSPDARALAALKRMLQELRQRATTVTRANPRRPFQLGAWTEWKRGWLERLALLGRRHGLQQPAPKATAAGRALQRAFRAMGALLRRYEGAIRGLAEARRQALVEVDEHLSQAARALRSTKP